MTPAIGWTEADYYRASRAARRAWQLTDSQLTIGLDETDAGSPPGCPSGPSVSSSPSGSASHRSDCLPDQAGSTPHERSRP